MVKAPEPVVTKEPVATPEPVVTNKLTTVKAPVLVKEPAALRPPKTERHERAAAPNVPATATGSVARETSERPRARPSSEVRLHNGVPLLD